MVQTDQTLQSIHRIFNARSVALVGATADPAKFGYMTLDSIIRGGYEGKIYPVNPKGGEIQGLRAYRSLSEIPGEVELLVVLVPAESVPKVLQEGAEKGAVGAVVCSGGFREVGRSDLESELRSITEKYGLRLIGPNIAGINYLSNKLCAMFFPIITTRGPLAIVSQSGTITNALSEWAVDDGLGISAAINLGNQVDLCESDFLNYFATDESTKAIAMYIEGVRDGRRFLDSINNASTMKPVIILKGGRTPVGQKSASSHTGSLASNSKVFNSACRQYGAIVAEELEALYDYAKALSSMRAPKGNRVFSISSSGGAGTLAADEADDHGLSFPNLPDEFKEELKKLPVSPLANLLNPFDSGADLNVEHFRQIALLGDQFDIADVIFLNFGDPMVGATEMLRDLSMKIKNSLAVGYFAGGHEERLGRVKMHRDGFAVFPAPERAIRGIAAVVECAQFHQVREHKVAGLMLSDQVRRRQAAVGQSFIPESKSIEYLKHYNISYPDHGLARNIEEAVQIAGHIGYPVVLKIVSPDVPHKTDTGGVVINLKTAEDVRHGYRQILERIQKTLPGASIEGLLVCQQIPENLEFIVGATDDPAFGPTIMFGLGGIFAEVFRDVAFRVAPLQRVDAENMVREIKGYSMLLGMRGQPRYDLQPLIELLLSTSQMIVDRAEIKELDLNPVRFYKKGIMVLDVRVMERKV
jgi:acyl-CoA synthetase (NDP forming)